MKDTSESVYGNPDLCPLSRRSIGNTIPEERNEVRSLSRPHLFFASVRYLLLPDGPLCNFLSSPMVGSGVNRSRSSSSRWRSRTYCSSHLSARGSGSASCFPGFRAFAIVPFRTQQTTSTDGICFSVLFSSFRHVRYRKPVQLGLARAVRRCLASKFDRVKLGAIRGRSSSSPGENNCG
jgi:hypothetical protein